MRNINSHCLTTALAAVLLGLSSCSNPPVEPDRIEPSSTPREVSKGVAPEVVAEGEAEQDAAAASLNQTTDARATEIAEVEEPIIEDFEVTGEGGALAPPSGAPKMKTMGPWMAGDQIDSGRAGVKAIEILEVHANGSGDVCGVGKSATLRYVAMKADGSVLDPGRRPFTFRVGSGQAIAGWDVVVATMRVGDSFTLMLPQELAYGPSKGDLKFDMELLSFK